MLDPKQVLRIAKLADAIATMGVHDERDRDGVRRMLMQAQDELEAYRESQEVQALQQRLRELMDNHSRNMH